MQHVWGEVYIVFRQGNMRERSHFEDPGVDGRTILRWIFRKWNLEDMGWIEMTRVRDRWRALVNAVMNPRVQ
jgi:hypothetical protein